MHKFVQLKRISLFRYHFLYMDVADYRSRPLLKKHKCHIRFHGQYHRKRDNYILVRCSVPKKELEGFVRAMHEMDKSMLLTGHTDYIYKSCIFFWNLENQMPSRERYYKQERAPWYSHYQVRVDAFLKRNNLGETA